MRLFPACRRSPPLLLVFYLLSFLLLPVLHGCHGAKGSADLLASARQYHQQGQPRAAIIELKNLLQKEPGHVEARLLLGTVYSETGEALSAEKELRKAQALGAPKPQVLPLLARTWLMLGQAEQVLKELPEHADNTVAIEAMRGESLLALGRTDQARALYNGMLARQSDQPEALLGLARIAALEQQLPSAELLVEQALRAQPASLEGLRLQGDLQRMQGRPAEAQQSYRRILALAPDNTQAHIDLANLALQQNRFDEAAAQLAGARKTAPSNLGVLQTQALLDFRQGRPKAALAALQQVLKARPEHMPALLLSGAVQLALGSPQLAENALQPFLAAHPAHLYANKMMASILLMRGRNEAAIELLLPLLQSAPEDVELLSLAGEAHLRSRRYAVAGSYFEKASALAPDTPRLHAALGISRLGLGETSRAINELERASVLDSKSPQASTMLVMTLLRNKDNAKALAAVEAMERQHGGNPLLHNLKGGVYLALHDAHAARASFNEALRHDAAYLPALTNLAALDQAENQPAQAQRRYEAALAKSPKNPQLQAALARLAASQGQVKKAQHWLEQAHKEHPDEVAPASLLCNFYLHTGAPDKALALARSLQSGHPDNIEALALRAQVEYSAGLAREALESYMRLATVQNASAPLQMRISSLHLAQGDHQDALQAARRALVIDPSLLEAQVVEVAMQLALKRPREALSAARRVQQQQPRLAAGYKLEGDVLLAQQQPREALAMYERAFQLDKVGPLQVQIYRALLAAGQESAADSRIETWLKANPDDLATRLYLAGSKLSGGQVRPAIRHYELIVAKQPGNVVALNDLAWAYLQAQDGRALDTAERARQLAPHNPAVLDTLGWIVLQQGDSARALALLQQAAGLAPASPEIAYHLGAALFKAGDKAAARRQLEQSLAGRQPFAQRAEAQAMLSSL